MEDQGWQRVRELAQQVDICCSLHGRAECVAAYHRKWREGALTELEFHAVLREFKDHCAKGAIQWFPMPEALVQSVTGRYRKLPSNVLLRAADALHLTSAAENRLGEIYSNDARLLAAAQHFGLRGVNVI